jgi:hypothetical protein
LLGEFAVTPNELMMIGARAFEAMGIPYAVTGSMASTRYAEYRSTNDVDILADIPEHRIREFIGYFPSDEFYVSEDAMRSAIANRGQFNIIHPTSGLKMDVILPGNEAHDRSQFVRARRLGDPSVGAMFVAPEDLILKKMWFYQMGESDKHLRDIASILKVQKETVDRQFISQWAQRLGLTEIWELILSKTS